MYRLKAYARATYRAPGQLSLVRLVQILVNSLAFYCPFIHADSGRSAQEANAHQSVDFLSDVFNSTVFTCCLDQFISTMDCIEQQCSDTMAVWSCYWNKEFGSSTYMHMSCGCWAICEDVGAEFPVRFPGQFTVIQQVEENLLVFF